MNRHQRRAEAAKKRPAPRRHEAVGWALDYMRLADDPTISGATVFLPDGTSVYLDAEAARSVRRPKEPLQ